MRTLLIFGFFCFMLPALAQGPQKPPTAEPIKAPEKLQETAEAKAKREAAEKAEKAAKAEKAKKDRERALTR